MVTTSSDRGLTIPTVNSDGNIWGGELNATINALDTILGGTLTLQSSAGLAVTLSSSQAQFSRVVVQGALTSNFNLTFASSNYALGNYQVWNNSSAGTGGVVCQTLGGGSICAVNPSTMRLVNVDGINAQFADTQSGLGVPAFVNKFRNAAMDIDQRGLIRTLGPSAIYTVDGWQAQAATGTPTADHAAYNTSISGNALRLTAPGGTATGVTIFQRIESTIAAQLLGATPATVQPITVQFSIYNGTPNSFTPQLSASYASARDSFGSVTNDLAPVNLQACPPAAVTTVAYTFTPNAALANGYQISLLFGNALNGIVGTILITRADVRATPGVAAGINSNPPTAEVRPNIVERLFCQRYLFFPPVNWWYLTAYATQGGVSTGTAAPFPTLMRVAPIPNNLTFVTANCGPPALVGGSLISQVFLITANGAGGYSANNTGGSFNAEL